jgi:hypothetical protein
MDGYLKRNLKKLSDKESVIDVVELMNNWYNWRIHELRRVFCNLTYDHDPRVVSLARDAIDEDSLNSHKQWEEFDKFMKEKGI